jgi:hypothetical protein
VTNSSQWSDVYRAVLQISDTSTTVYVTCLIKSAFYAVHHHYQYQRKADSSSVALGYVIVMVSSYHACHGFFKHACKWNVLVKRWGISIRCGFYFLRVVLFPAHSVNEVIGPRKNKKTVAGAMMTARGTADQIPHYIMPVKITCS